MDDLTISQALSNWLGDLADTRSPETLKSYDYAVRAFSTWLHTAQPQIKLASQLDATVLKAYVDYLINRGLDDRTLHQYVGVLTRWLRSLIDAGELAGVRNQRGKLMSAAGVRAMLAQQLPRLEPAVAPRVPNLQQLPAYYAQQLRAFLTARPGYIALHDKPAELRMYLNLLRNRALIATLFSTGGRINEVLSLTLRGVRPRGVVVDAVRITGKGRKQRSLHLNQLARSWIADYLEARAAFFPDANALFISHGPRGKGQALSDVSAWKIVKEAAEALADLRRTEGATEADVQALLAVSPHSLRHFLAQAMLDEGADYKDLTAILGHSSAVVTEQYYARLDDERVLEIIDTFAPRPTLEFGTTTGRPNAPEKSSDDHT